MKKNIWEMTKDDVALFDDKKWRWKRDFRRRQPMIGVVTLRELVEIGNEKNRQCFIRGIEAEMEE